jgi:hypothetical protein
VLETKVLTTNIESSSLLSHLGSIKDFDESSPKHQNFMKEYCLEEIAGPKRMLSKFPSKSKGTIGNRYQFRAECNRDAELFTRTILWFIEPSWTMLPFENYPDVEVTFTLKKEISPRSLLWIACSIVDGHTIVQTLEREDKYTGNRDYHRRMDVDNPRYKPSALVLADMKKGIAHYVKTLKILHADAKEFEKYIETLN